VKPLSQHPNEKEKADGFRRHPLFYHKDSVENKV
jgi:hypothetical protein